MKNVKQEDLTGEWWTEEVFSIDRKGKWVKEHPVKKGHYLACIRWPDFSTSEKALFEVREDGEGMFMMMAGSDMAWELTDPSIKWWWSEPIVLPDFPEEE